MPLSSDFEVIISHPMPLEDLVSSWCILSVIMNIKQVIAAWPFMQLGPKWNADTFVQTVHSLGIAGVELLDHEHWHLLEQTGLVCAATRSHSFIRGMNNLNHQEECLNALRDSIDVSAEAGFPNVMTFSGALDTRDQPNGSLVTTEEGFANCVAGYQKITPYAEQKGISLILEPLNTKVAQPRKGHPGYQADHIAECIEIIKAVDSPALKLLFDVYHIQIMDGDIIRHIEQYFEFIGHVQIAGVPGRGEIDRTQEINYPAVMRALVQQGYQGYVGHEWIPTRDPIEGLKEAIEICDV